jgi:HEAT repeat protein
MNKIQIITIFCFLAILAACTSHQLQYSSENDISLDQLISHLPARDSVESALIFNAILGYGQDAVVEVCQQLDSKDHKYVSQAEWALHGLATHVTEKGKENHRQIYIRGLKRALELSLPVDSKVFITSQFQTAGGDESVPELASFIDDPDLYEPAIQALAAIGSESAGEALLNALPTATDKPKISIILALGTMRYEPAGKVISSFLTDSTINVQDVSSFAVSIMGYLPANLPLKLLAEKDDRFVTSYLRLAERLGDKGDVESCLTICNDIIKNENGYYSDGRIINALSIGVKYNPGRTKEHLFRIISGQSKQMRLSALQLVDDYEIFESVPELITLAKDKTSEVQLEIIEILGRQKSESMFLFLRESLKSQSSEVRMKSLKALSERKDVEFLPDILIVMQDSLDEYESNQVQSILLTYADSLIMNYLMGYFNDFPIPSKILLLNILSERKNSTYLSYFKESLNSRNKRLRLSAIKGLEVGGDDTLVDRLIVLLLKSEDEKEQVAAIRAISSITNRSTSKRELVTLITGYYDNSTNNQKILLFRIFKAVGGKELMNITVREAQRGDEQIRKAAIYSLAAWSDTDVLDILIDFGRNEQNERFRIIALRGALRILRENPMGEQRALSYFQEIMNAATRPEEKRLILAGLAEIKTTSSLRLISSVLDDSDINHEAFLAALMVSSLADDKDKNLSRDEIVVALIGPQADVELGEKIKIYSQNHITIPEPPEGFRNLFNGLNLDGWKGLVENPVKRAQMSEDELRLAQIEVDKFMHKHWQVVDGILYFDGKGSHLCTIDDFTDFELYVDWKIEKEGDSGIYLRGSPQVQIWDPAQWPEGSGGLYNNQSHPNKPLHNADNPVGEWNTFYIIMRGERVSVYLNEVLVVDNVLMENYWERDKSIYPTGQIELQSHNTPLYFKNIFIRELEPRKPLFNGNLFNGKDLNGWQVIGNSSDSWQVQDSIMYTDGTGGGWISTVREYTDFILNLEFRLPKGGNSGVFLRAPHQGDPAYTGMEIQILDDYAEKYSGLKKWQYSGSIYGLQAPLQRVSKKAGEWQKLEIVCSGSEVKVSLNGTEILEANLIDFMHQEDVHPGIKRRKGYIGLQNHSTRIEFRNIYLKELK